MRRCGAAIKRQPPDQVVNVRAGMRTAQTRLLQGGMKMCCLSRISRAEAAPITSSRTEPTTERLGVGCGGKRYRDPITHRCRGPADFGN